MTKKKAEHDVLTKVEKLSESLTLSRQAHFFIIFPDKTHAGRGCTNLKPFALIRLLNAFIADIIAQDAAAWSSINTESETPQDSQAETHGDSNS